MAGKTKTTNKVLFDTIRDLKKLSAKTGTNVFRAVATKLEAPASQRTQINLSKLERKTKDKDVVSVPGKVLGDGVLTKKVTVVAFSASDSAKAKIEKAGSTFVEIREYIKGKPDPKIRIFA